MLNSERSEGSLTADSRLQIQNSKIKELDSRLSGNDIAKGYEADFVSYRIRHNR